MRNDCCTPARVRVELVGGPADGQAMTMATGPGGQLPLCINVPAAPPADLRIVEPGDGLRSPATMFDHLVYERPASVSDHDHVWRYTFAPRSH